jgi:hypothetical protein
MNVRLARKKNERSTALRQAAGVLDETWASTNMTPRYGRCKKGEPLIAHIPFGHWKTTTLIGAP